MSARKIRLRRIVALGNAETKKVSLLCFNLGETYTRNRIKIEVINGGWPGEYSIKGRAVYAAGLISKDLDVLWSDRQLPVRGDYNDQIAEIERIIQSKKPEGPMDPNQALTEIRALLKQLDNMPNTPDYHDGVAIEELCTRVQGLDEWLSKGGFLPTAWNESLNLAKEIARKNKVFERILAESCDSGEVRGNSVIEKLAKEGMVDPSA